MSKILPTMKVSWCIWIVVQLFNFLLVPVHVCIVDATDLQYQLLVVNVVSIFWNAFLSYQTNKSPKPAKHAHTPTDDIHVVAYSVSLHNSRGSTNHEECTFPLNVIFIGR